ncbi:uncharacterized protein HaLaN_05606, partial [Haematococcus lacustris]
MAAEMEVKKLELALELQKAQAPAQLAAWAAEQEHQAVVDQAAQEERAAAERLRLEADKLMQHAPAPAAPAPPAPVRAPPAVAQAAPVVVDQSAPPAPSEQAEQQEDAAELSAVASAFDRLGPEFLADLQGALEQQGHDLSNEALVQRLAGDGSLPDALLPLLARSAGSARKLAMLREMVRQWQRAVQQQMELQRKLAKKDKRPVWHCAVCGRYGCPVKPYIERYEEVDLP